MVLKFIDIYTRNHQVDVMGDTPVSWKFVFSMIKVVTGVNEIIHEFFSF